MIFSMYWIKKDINWFETVSDKHFKDKMKWIPQNDERLYCYTVFLTTQICKPLKCL